MSLHQRTKRMNEEIVTEYNFEEFPLLDMNSVFFQLLEHLQLEMVISLKHGKDSASFIHFRKKEE